MAWLRIIKNLLFFHLICIDGCYLNVTQPLSEIYIERGSSALLACQWNSSCEMQQIRISWFKDGKEINSEIQTRENVSSSHRGKTYLEIHNTTYATLNINDTDVNETGVYWCNVIVEIPLPLRNGTGPGTTLKFNVNKTNQDWKSTLTVPIAAALAGAAILVILFAGYRCLRRTCWLGGNDIPVYVNNKVPPKSSEDHSTNTAEEIQTAPDFSSKVKAFQVNPAELAETRNKMKEQKARFLSGNVQLKRKTEGQFKRKRSLHIYINNRELKKHCKQTTDASDNKYKAHKSHKTLRKQNRMKGMSEDIYQNVGC
ncbi:hypothetical protein AOXY_G104 [Acipenser oxyrinchus oxyrinchus]|uniref:Ig-like domain-containing protein n=1 Tax=Acipenser oxyrinchus oxyrinchus TaxID=40147 RepID=A0AAD8LUC2_ACIOX|nr:hypothetical protein AOXY_G104 [Acipenser oxyrinchus oxyrinchus]